MDRMLEAFASQVIRFRWLVLVVFVAVVAFFARQLPDIEIDPEVKSQLPSDMPSRLNIDTIEEAFGGTEILMVVLTTDDVLATPTLERLQAISDGLEAMPQADRVMGLFTLTDIHGESGMMVVEDAIDSIPANDEERESLRARLKANDLIYGNVLSEDFTAVSTIVMLSTDASDDESTDAVRQVLEAHPGPENVEIGGMPVVRTHVSQDIRGDFRKFLPVGLLVMLVFLYLCFRRARGVLLPFVVVVMSVIVAMGLLPLFGWKLQMVMVVLPVIMLAVANDYGIHLMAKYQEDNRPGAERESKALAKGVLKSLGLPTITAGVTTMAGLLCLTTHIIIPAQQMGVLAAIGVGFAICGSLIFIPAVLAILPVPEPLAHFGDAGKKGFLDRLLERVAEKVIAVPRGIIAVSVLLGLLACAGVMKVIVDTNPINYYPPNSPVAQTSSLINKHFGGSTELSIMLEGDIQDPTVLGRIDELDSRLKELPQVGTTSGINQVVRKMHMAVSDGDASADRIPDNKETVAQLFLLYSMGGDPDDFARMVDFGFERALLKIRINSLSTKGISEVVRASEEILATQEWEGTPIVGGFGAVFAELVEAVVKGQVASLLLSFLLVFLMVGAAFRSVVAGLFAVIPLGLAMPMLFGLMGVLGIELNVVTAMLSSIMIGVGVDYTIHFLWRFRDLRRMGTAPDKAVVETLTTTGRGIVFNALSVIIGFAVLLLSQFLPVQFFGFLVVISISACLIGALVLLPAICLVVQPKFLEPEV